MHTEQPDKGDKKMTLREFIEREIKEGRVRDLDELRTKVRLLEWEDEEKIDPRRIMEYLDCDIEWALVTPLPSYKISLFRKVERIKKSQREEK